MTRKFLGLAVLVAGLLLAVMPARAATITVGAGCTFKQAWDSAFDDATPSESTCTAGSGNDTIELQADVALGETIWEGSAGNGTLTVNGNGYAIRGDGTYRFFALWGAPTITFNNISFTGAVGDDRESGGAFNPYSGAGTYTFNDCAFHNNEVLKIVQGTGGNGGAISAGSATTITINRCAFYNNRAVVGGAIFTSGALTVSNSSFYNNQSTVEGGAVRIAHTGNKAGYFRHVTMTNNRAGTGHSALQFSASATNSHLVNSILWGNSPRDCRVDTEQVVAFPRLTTNSGSFTGASNCDFEQRNQGIKEDPQLAGPFGGYYIPRAGSPAINRVTCLAANQGGNVDQRGQPRPLGSQCDAGAIEHVGYIAPPPASEDRGASGGSSSGAASGRARVGARVSTCLTLEGIAVYNAGPATQCQRVNAMQIANPSIREGEFVDAVDVWSWVLPNTRVCFEAAGGGFKFIDTASMPRTVSDLEACSMGGLTCATINGIGQLALLPGEADASCAPLPAQATAAPTAIPRPTATAIWSRDLVGCMVKAEYALNMRDAPAGAIIGGVAYGARLTALARTVGWFKVDNMGREGWIAAMYVSPEGACD